MWKKPVIKIYKITDGTSLSSDRGAACVVFTPNNQVACDHISCC